jgi:hypothetical protein
MGSAPAGPALRLGSIQAAQERTGGHEGMTLYERLPAAPSYSPATPNPGKIPPSAPEGRATPRRNANEGASCAGATDCV